MSCIIALPSFNPIRPFNFRMQNCLTNCGLLGLLGAVLASTCCSARNTTQIQSSSNKMIPHTRTILCTSTSHQHNTMLLNIVSLARNIRRNNSSSGKLHTSGFSLTRVGLLGSNNTNTETDTLQSGTICVGQSRRDSVACALAFSDTAEYLVQCSWASCCGSECAGC